MVTAEKTAEQLTWDEVVALEPRLIAVRDDLVARLRRSERPHDALLMELFEREDNEPSIRQRMDALAGWHSSPADARLQTPEVRMVVNDRLVDTVYEFENGTVT